MVAVLADHIPETPIGNPLKLAPVTPDVAYEILVMELLMQGVCALVATAERKVIVLLAMVGCSATVRIVAALIHPILFLEVRL